MEAEETRAVDALVIGVHDARRVMAYLLAPESDEYVLVMGVLEQSVTDRSPAQVGAALRAAGTPLDPRVVEVRLEKLRDWGAATARTDTSNAQRYSDLLARNWRYTATQPGRQTHRFYRQHLANVPTMREIPLTSLNRVVLALQSLASMLDESTGGASSEAPVTDGAMASRVNELFTSHDDLDGALVGAEDSLAALADRFDLDDSDTVQLKTLLVEYATHVGRELELGAALAHDALRALSRHTPRLVAATVATSTARALIERGALVASRGGRETDWEGLAEWFDPATGRAARFGLTLVRALPGMHANLRRLHTATATATTRARALTFARACLDPEYGVMIWHAAVADHSWRKLAGAADEEETIRGATTWRDGPKVELSDMLRTTGRTGTRGRAAAALDDTAQRARLLAARRERELQRSEAVAEVLSAGPRTRLSPHGARVALAALNAAARGSRRRHGSYPTARTASRDGLACTIFYTPGGGGPTPTGVVIGPTWTVTLPGRMPVFHEPGALPAAPHGADDDGKTVAVHLVRGVA